VYEILSFTNSLVSIIIIQINQTVSATDFLDK